MKKPGEISEGKLPPLAGPGFTDVVVWYAVTLCYCDTL
jgi:hypothetical protein